MDIVWAAGDVPSIVEFTREAEVVIEIIEAERKAAFDNYDRVQLPAFQELSKTLATRDGVRGGKREAVAKVEIAVAAFGSNVETVLGAEMAIAAGLVD